MGYGLSVWDWGGTFKICPGGKGTACAGYDGNAELGLVVEPGPDCAELGVAGLIYAV